MAPRRSWKAPREGRTPEHTIGRDGEVGEKEGGQPVLDAVAAKVKPVVADEPRRPADPGEASPVLGSHEEVHGDEPIVRAVVAEREAADALARVRGGGDADEGQERERSDDYPALRTAHASNTAIALET